MVAPPLSAGAIHETVEATSSPEVAVTPVGASGVVDGVAEALEATLVPATLVAVTWKV